MPIVPDIVYIIRSGENHEAGCIRGVVSIEKEAKRLCKLYKKAGEDWSIYSTFEVDAIKKIRTMWILILDINTGKPSKEKYSYTDGIALNEWENPYYLFFDSSTYDKDCQRIAYDYKKNKWLDSHSRSLTISCCAETREKAMERCLRARRLFLRIVNKDKWALPKKKSQNKRLTIALEELKNDIL